MKKAETAFYNIDAAMTGLLCGKFAFLLDNNLPRSYQSTVPAFQDSEPAQMFFCYFYLI
ncbi:hypothetical protein [Rheinheimera sp.]|uniref:hypothetical protein n=1 Tax=Rheinheimera sp. TaxID=1869214 RepID=UPI0027B99719|nr:hypothetical protein [Rheinheimera sp.]